MPGAIFYVDQEYRGRICAGVRLYETVVEHLIYKLGHGFSMQMGVAVGFDFYRLGVG